MPQVFNDHEHRVLLESTSFSRVIAMASDKMEVRLTSITIVFMLMYQLVEPGSYILFIEDSVTGLVAASTRHRELLGLLFYLAASLVVPLLFLLIFWPAKLKSKIPRQMAVVASLSGALLWGIMATRSMEIDILWLTTVFAVRAFVDLGLGLLFGVSLNAQHAREELERHKRKEERRHEAAGFS